MRGCAFRTATRSASVIAATIARARAMTVSASPSPTRSARSGARSKASAAPIGDTAERRDEKRHVVVAVLQPHLERDLFEERSLQSEEQAVRPCREIATELRDATVGVGVAARDELGPAIERDAHARHGSSD